MNGPWPLLRRALTAAGLLCVLAFVRSAAMVPAVGATQTTGDYAYRVLLLRAAPGQLTQLMDLYGARLPVYEAAGEDRPVILRHSQGDRWDLMLVWPVGSLEAFYSSDRTRRRAHAARAVGAPDEAEFERRLRELTAWRQELFVEGVGTDDFYAAADGSGMAHIEMFVSLPGKYDELLRQRDMEGVYLAATGRRPNLVFTRLAGAEWDLFTLGFYPDMIAFATEPDLSPEAFEEAARTAGFESRGTIGTYLRSLIDYHNDTLAVVVE